MSVDLSIRINGKDHAAALKALNRLADNAKRPIGGLKNVGFALRKNLLQRFDDQEDPDGKPWAKLAPLTVAQRDGKTGPILNRSGALKTSATYSVTSTAVRVGVNTPYAAAHNYGVTIKPKIKSALAIPTRAGFKGKNRDGSIPVKSVTIPARPMVGFSKKDETDTTDAIEAYLEAE